MPKRIKDLMTPKIVTCSPSAALGEVAALLDKHQVHALFVAEEAEIPLGVITDFDVMAGEWLSQDKESLSAMQALTAAELMSSPVDSIDADAPIEEALTRFEQTGVARFLVTENQKPIGVLSLSDFAASLAQEIKPKRETVEDVMSHAILTCRRASPALSAAYAMSSSGWRSVVVVNEHGTALGIISGYDLLPLLKAGANKNVTAEEIMHPALTIDKRASLSQAADMLVQNHHHRLLVVDQNDPEAFPLGALSTFDIVAEMARPASVWRKF
ncbi:MAG: hypothetical protein Fur002_01720 [Anaerolineales bacterium]